jgi:hypothetical protein
MTVNEELLGQVVADALKGVAGNARWMNAIRRGAELIRDNRCVPQDDDTLLILSPSGHDYLTTVDECKDVTGALCPAFKLNRPCKHRAAFRLIVRYREREAASEDKNKDDA